MTWWLRYKPEDLADSERELHQLIDACRKGDRKSQDLLYRKFYGYAMGICLRYAKNREEAIDVVNDGFFKVLTRLDKYTKGLSFKGWLRKVMINSAIDNFRRNQKHYQSVELTYSVADQFDQGALEKLTEKEIIEAIQELPPSYKMVFNLFVIEGYKHQEISQKLGISTGTSKSNLSIARDKLKRSLKVQQQDGWRNHG